MSDLFEEFWGLYPKRKGGNPRHPARTAFDRALKHVTGDKLLLAVKEYARHPDTQPGTPYVPMASTWLNQRRWLDFLPSEVPTPRAQKNEPVLVFVALGSSQWQAWARHLGHNPPVNKSFGWYFPSSWPPGYSEAGAA